MDNSYRNAKRRVIKGDALSEAKQKTAFERAGILRPIPEDEVRAFFIKLAEDSWCEPDIKIEQYERGDKTGYEVSVSAMYTNPITVSYGTLNQIAEFFGTRQIDVDDWADRGCETCDHGSDYGHAFQIMEPKIVVVLNENH